MLFDEKVIFRNEEYCILYQEKDNLIIDLINDQKPIWKSYIGHIYATYQMEEQQLLLNDITMDAHLMKEEEEFLGQEAIVDEETNTIHYTGLSLPLTYTGGIVIASHVIDGYEEEFLGQELPCYAYEHVYEMLMEDGCLITLIDHAKAMKRIRKNIEYGLRSTDSKKDIRVINKFIRDTFGRKYTKNNKNRSIKKLLYRLKKNK